MKNRGQVIKIDNAGRVIIPKKIRSTLGIKDYDPLDVSIDAGRIILQKHVPCCIFCSETKNTVEFKNKLVCAKCKKELCD